MTTPAAPYGVNTRNVWGAHGSLVDFGNDDTSVTNYQYSTDNTVTWTSLNPPSANSPIDFSFLTVGNYDCINIRAVNDVGYSDSVDALNVFVPTGVSSIAPGSDSYAFGSPYVYFTNENPTAINYQYNLQYSPIDGWVDIIPAQTTSPLNFAFLMQSPNILFIRPVYSSGISGGVALVSDPLQFNHTSPPTLTSSGITITVVSGWHSIDEYQWSLNASTINSNRDGTFNLQLDATWSSPIAGITDTIIFTPTGLSPGVNTIYVRSIWQGVPGRVSSIDVTYNPIMLNVARGGSHVVSQQITSILVPTEIIASADATLIAGEYEGDTTIQTIDLSNDTNISSIPDNAFLRCTALASVTLHASTTTIGTATFQGCTALTSITVPSSVAVIGAGALAGTALTSITLTGPATIGAYAFAVCTSMTTATI